GRGDGGHWRLFVGSGTAGSSPRGRLQFWALIFGPARWFGAPRHEPFEAREAGDESHHQHRFHRRWLERLGPRLELGDCFFGGGCRRREELGEVSDPRGTRGARWPFELAPLGAQENERRLKVARKPGD